MQASMTSPTLISTDVLDNLATAVVVFDVDLRVTYMGYNTRFLTGVHGPGHRNGSRAGVRRDDGRRPVVRNLRPRHRPQRLVLPVHHLRSDDRLLLSFTHQPKPSECGGPPLREALRCVLAMPGSPFPRRVKPSYAH